MCFVDIATAYDRVLKKVMEWAMRKKGLSEVIVRAVMSLNHRAKTKVRVGSELSERICGTSWCTSTICVVGTAFCNCSGCNLGKCERRIDQRNFVSTWLGFNEKKYRV